MRFGVEPAQDLGLHHALRNGIAILDGRDPGQDRTRVLKGLVEIVTDADRGSGALREHSLTFALTERSAFERYSLFVRYLSKSVENLSERLTEAKQVLEDLQEGRAITDQRTASAEDLLTKLLAALERDRNLTQLKTVRDVHYG